jgi:hypothetical protein
MVKATTESTTKTKYVPKSAKARETLLRLFREGDVYPVTVIMAELRKDGATISRPVQQRLREEIGIITERRSRKEGRGIGYWVWRLDPQRHPIRARRASGIKRKALPSRNGYVICCVNGICNIPEARWHGVPDARGYLKHKCHCTKCVQAYDAFTEDQRRKHAPATDETDPDETDPDETDPDETDPDETDPDETDRGNTREELLAEIEAKYEQHE